MSVIRLKIYKSYLVRTLVGQYIGDITDVPLGSYFGVTYIFIETNICQVCLIFGIRGWRTAWLRTGNICWVRS